MKSKIKIIVIAAIVGGLAGSTATYAVLKTQKPSNNDLIRGFYETENAVHVSPHSLRKMMDKGDKGYILVDLRSPQEYEKEHIIGAVNIPAYKDPNTSAYDEFDRIWKEFRRTPIERDVIVYCYSMPCMTGRKIGKMLAEKEIFVKHLGIGWNEWRNSWNLWNHDGETLTKVEDYIQKGIEPGTPKQKDAPTPCGNDDLSC